ncbi:DotI/IcmL/TraM family protein [Flexibacterium corallicola]|uniref:DotI/IcmL/TraM family protein n=1 Tax=Flexibacterium corallicola TaxID=3037259 RepID=UPI00286EC9EE|nr:DotI/IcmL/TraM family protein [Pseudovibrio sp. M1P-2-3]
MQSQLDKVIGAKVAIHATSRESYQTFMRIIFGLICIIALLSFFIIYLAMRPVEERNYAVDPQGRILPLQALSEPIQSDNYVINWASTSLQAAYTMSWASMEEFNARNRHNFTDAGWHGFEKAITQSGFLENMTNNQVITSAVANGVPIINARGVTSSGQYGWLVEVPLMLQMRSASKVVNKSLLAQITIVRRPVTENPRGLGIAQITTQ